jgi:flagellar protein FlaF
MGFSVSGSAAIVFVGVFVAFGALFTATSNGYERVSEAEDVRSDRTLDRENAAVEAVSATYDPETDELTVVARNAGSTALSVDDVDLLANNSYLTGYGTAVEGDTATGLWLPAETLTVTVSTTEDPGRVKLVAGSGVAATTTTEVV